MRRRKLLQTGGALTLFSIPLAGCSGDGDGDSDGDSGNGDSGGSGDGDDDGGSDSGGDGDTSDGDDGSGKDIITGGDATMTFDVAVAGQQNSDIDQFEELTIAFERVLFEQESGGFAEVEIGEEIDLTTLVGGSETYADAIDFPAGTYTRAELHFSVSSATLTGGTEPSFDRTTPAEIDLEILDEFYEIESGRSTEFNLRIRVAAPRDDGGTWQFVYGHSRT